MALTFIATSDSANPLKFPRSTVMENEALLDPRGQMLVRWTIVANGTGIEMEFIANCTGWMGIEILSERFNDPAPGFYDDMILFGYDDLNDKGYVEDNSFELGVPITNFGGDRDFWQDWTILNASYQQPWSVVRMLRRLDTGDDKDLPIIAGPMNIGWAFSDSDDTNVFHDLSNSGFDAVITFIP